MHRKRVPMLGLKCLQSVTERDIDMLLVEELEASVQFREWLASGYMDNLHTRTALVLGIP